MKRFSRVYIEISNICNLQCDFCPEVGRDSKTMSTELFSHLLDQVKPLTEEITFHLMGEPLAHPKFADFVNLAFEKNVPVNLTTNGTLLNKRENASLLLSPAFRQVNFSLQSFFSNFKGRDVVEYFRPIAEWTKRALEIRPDLYVNYRFWNDGSAQEFLERETFFAPIEKEFGVEINRSVDVSFKKSKNLVGRLYLHFDSRFVWPHQSAVDPTLEPRIQGTCQALKNHFAIHADGTVVPCCLDKEAQIILGRVGPDALGILEVLNSHRATEMRRGFDDYRLKESLCQKCTYIHRFDRKATPAVLSKPNEKAANINSSLAHSNHT